MFVSTPVRRFFITTLSLLAAGFVLFFSLWRLNLSLVGNSDRAVTESMPASERLKELVTPPFLPDHPLYLLGMLSDRVDLLLSSPEERFALKLKLADTRLATSQILITKKRPSLALTTLTKAEKYIISAAEDLPKLDSQKQNDAMAMLSNTIKTHQTVLIAMKPDFDGAGQADIDALVEQILVRSPNR